MISTRVELPVRGMHCASCVARIERGLTAVPGVREANVNLAAERASVAFDPARVDVTALARAIHDLGYEVPTRTVTLSVGGMSCASCVAKIERGLRALPGVARATVNLATERATVDALPPRREGAGRRRRARRGLRRGRVDAHRREPASREAPGRRGLRGDAQPDGDVPLRGHEGGRSHPSWRRSSGSSRRPKARSPRSSRWPTGSPVRSFRWSSASRS